MATFSALLPLLFCAAMPVLAEDPRPSNILVVTGRGDRSVQTNKALVQLGVEVEAKTATEAQAGLARKADAVVNKLRELQVEKLQTTSINLSAKYEYVNNRQNQVGFTASTTVSFQTPIDRTGTTLDAAVAAGANRIDQISFIAPDLAMRTARNAALQDAVRDAQEQADAVLSVLKLTAKSVRTIQIGGGSAPITPFLKSRAALAAESAPAPTPVIGGEQRVETTVTLEISY